MCDRCWRCSRSLGKSRKDPEARSEVPNFQSRLSAMPVRAQVTLQQALAGLAAQAPTEKADKPMLLKLAEHVAIRFALDSYERGELRVNAVKQLLDRMNAEIEGLRKILGTQEEMMANAGLQVQSYTELLDQEFWEQVPDENKKEVLTSDEAWCVPPRNVRAYLEDMLKRGELKTVNEILMKYATCIGLENPEARRTTAIGLSDLAELYGSGDGSALMEGIRRLGNQLAIEREPELQTLVSAAFVRLSQEAASKRCYPAMQQAWLRSTASRRSGPARRRVCARASARKSGMPEFVEEALRSGHIADGMVEILALMPKTTLHYVTNRFGHCGFREDCELLGEIVHNSRRRSDEPLDGSAANRPSIRSCRNGRLADAACARSSRENFAGAPVAVAAQRARPHHPPAFVGASGSARHLLVELYDSLDPMIRPLAIDEMGMSGHHACISKLLELAQDGTIPGFTRLKAIEALGRLRATAASPLLQHIMEARQLWRYYASRRVAHRRGSGADAHRCAPRARKAGAEWPGSQGFDARTDRSRSECVGDSPAALRAPEIVAQSGGDLDELARKYPARDSGTQSWRRRRSRRSSSRARLDAQFAICSRRACDQGAGCRARRPSSGDGVRIRRYGTRRTRAASETIAGIWGAADGGSSNESHQTAWPRCDVEELTAEAAFPRPLVLLLYLSQ